jgi:hypothetical protein
MIRLPSAPFRTPYAKPFTEMLEAGFGSHLEMECLCGLIRGHLEKARQSSSGHSPSLFEIGTHRGAGICHFHEMAPDLEIHSLNVLPEQLAHSPRLMSSEILPPGEIGRYALERGIPFTQHLSDSRTFDWEGLAQTQTFDIVFIDGSHEQFSVMADTLNALRILRPDGMLIWHDYKAIDEPGRQVFATVNDLDAHEFGGQIQHIEGTWLAFAHHPEQKPGQKISGSNEPRQTLAEEFAWHLARERRVTFAEKARRLPAEYSVLFFSDHHQPNWPADAELEAPGGRCHATRDPRMLKKADVVVFHLPQIPKWYRLPKKERQIWIGVTMESDSYYPEQADPDRVATLDWLISYHAHADIRLNYSFPGLLSQLEAPPPEKHPGKLICALISNPNSRSGRERLVERLERLLPMHHYGSWHSSRPGPPPEGREAKLAILRKYHFCLAFENSLQPDYVTEKWYDCLLAGCVPVYLGAPNIEDYAPGPGAYLDVRSFTSLEKLAETIQAAAADPNQYCRFFEWKHQMRPAFRQLYTDEMNRLPLLAKIDRVIQEARECPSDRPVNPD